ncbi:MAG: alpha/beta hydrolase, partial [Bacteroidales bacterium]
GPTPTNHTADRCVQLKPKAMKKSICFVLFLLFGYGLTCAQDDTKSIIEEEVEINVDDLTISGTFTIPISDKAVPLAILISGGFADNRDAEAYGLKPFKELAWFFAENGIATYRYDDRGVGKSTGKHTFQYEIAELANDVFAAIRLFKHEDRIDTNKIGLIGHSMGGMMAPMIASMSDDVSFIIALAGSVGEMDKMYLKAREKRIKQAGWEEEDIETALELEKRMVEVTVNGKGSNELINDMRTFSKNRFEKLPANIRNRYKDWEAYYKPSWYGMMEPYINTPMMRSFYTHQPKEYLRKVKCPALFLFAENDGLIPGSYEGPIIIDAMETAGNYNYTIRQIPHTGHYFSYEGFFVPGFLNILTNWIKEQFDY